MADLLRQPESREPVEYAVAVERYLMAARLSEGSRRVYRIALATWAWALADRTPPAGRGRRRAAPPVLPLALLDDPRAALRLRAAVAARAAEPRTVNRELSALRGAIGWWRAQGWLATDPLADQPAVAAAEARAPLDEAQVRAVLALPAPLRDQVCWHLVHESGAPIERILALNVDDVDCSGRRGRGRAAELSWGAGAARLLPLLLVSRAGGPLLLTDRRAPAGVPAADRCPLTGRGRLSYRRAAEVFTAATRELDPAGRGWTLGQLRLGARGRRTAGPA
jgi:integrase/recombinase XerD